MNTVKNHSYCCDDGKNLLNLLLNPATPTSFDSKIYNIIPSNHFTNAYNDRIHFNILSNKL